MEDKIKAALDAGAMSVEAFYPNGIKPMRLIALFEDEFEAQKFAQTAPFPGYGTRLDESARNGNIYVVRIG